MLVEEFLQRLAGFGTDLLERNALMADDDALLAVALHVDGGVDQDILVRFLELLHNHFHRIGYLLVIIKEYLLANDFGDEESGGLVGPLVFGEIGRRVGQELLDARKEVVHIEARLGRDGEDFGLRQEFVPSRHLRF